MNDAAFELRRGKSLMKDAAFELRKWASNAKELLNRINESDGIENQVD